MLRDLLVICLLIPLFVSTAFAQEGKITGVAKDADTGEPLPFVSIVIEGTNRGVQADNSGDFVINHLAPRSYTVIASLVGYETVVQEIDLAPGQNLSIDIELYENPLEMPAVVVTGTRTPRYIKEVPVYTEVITRKTITDKSAHNLYEALDGELGIRVEQQCQACNFSVLRLQGLGADHTQLLLDGQPVYSGLASVYGLQQLSTADIEQIEIVKGAGSALYGSNAIAGAINIISAVPQRTKGEVSIEVGEYGTNKYEITAATRKGNLGIYLFAQANRGDVIDVSGDGLNSDEVEQPDGVADRVKTDSRNAGFNLIVDGLGELDRLTIRGRILSEIRQGGMIEDNYYENPFTEGTERIITDRYSTEVGYVKEFPGGNEINLNLSYAHHTRNATNDTFLGDYTDIYGEPPPVDELRPYIAGEDLYVATFNYIHPLGAGSHRILAGVQYTYNNLEESGKYVVVDETDDNFGTAYTSFSEKNANEIGAYLQDEFRATDKLEVVGGLRFDYHKSEDNFRGSGSVAPNGIDPLEYDESTVNPRFAVKYSATPDFTLRGSVGTGFRVPYGFSEDLHLCSGSPRVYKGADLQPEKSISYGLTADYAISKAAINLNIYRTNLKNAIGFSDADDDVAALGYTYQWENIDDAYVMGAEIGAQVALTKNLAVAVNFAYSKGEYDNVREDWIGTPFEEDSKMFSRHPEAASGFKIDFSPRDWSFILDGNYKGKMYIDYFEEGEEPTKIKETEPYMILNAVVSKQVFDCFKVHVGIKNLTGYIQEERHTDDAAFMYAPVYGRILYGGLQVSLQ